MNPPATSLTWFHPLDYPKDRAEWLSRVFRESHGIHLEAVQGNTAHHLLRCSESDTQLLLKHSGKRPEKQIARLQADQLGLSRFPHETDLPVLLGEPFHGDQWIEKDQGEIKLGIDFFGFIFSVLSREEELEFSSQKLIDRFPADESLLVRTGLLERPIVDEYVEVLWSIIRQTWPGIDRTRRQGRVIYSCDVDIPLDAAATSWRQFWLRCSADLVKRRSPGLMVNRAVNAYHVRRGKYARDPNNQFEWILELLDRESIQARFYIFGSRHKRDGCGWYDLNHPFLEDLLRRISSRGHMIGLHGSFKSHGHWETHKEEKGLLETTCRRLGILQEITHNRQHHLKWDSRVSPSSIERAGFVCDSTGGFAEIPGFRFGTSIPFPMWDWLSNQGIGLMQEPLILMECSLLDPVYMGLNHFPEGLAKALKLKERSLAYGGDFTILWHNSSLRQAADKVLLSRLLGSS